MNQTFSVLSANKQTEVHPSVPTDQTGDTISHLPLTNPPTGFRQRSLLMKRYDSSFSSLCVVSVLNISACEPISWLRYVTKCGRNRRRWTQHSLGFILALLERENTFRSTTTANATKSISSKCCILRSGEICEHAPTFPQDCSDSSVLFLLACKCTRISTPHHSNMKCFYRFM